MSVQNDGTDEGTNDQGDQETENSDQGDSEQNSQHNDANDDAGNGGNKSKNSQDDKDSRRGNSADDDKEDGEDDDTPPPTRKSKLQYIQERQEKARLKRAQQNQNNQRKVEKDDSENDEDYDDLSEDQKKVYDKMEKVFQKRYGEKFQKVDKVLESNEHNEINSEITTFLKNDEYSDLIAEHEKTLRKYAMHPSRREVPIDEIMYGIAGKKLIAYGAEMARKAMKEARKSRNAGGSSNRKVEGSQSKSVSEMTDAEFREEQRRVLQGRK